MDDELKGIENLISAIEENINPLIDAKIKKIGLMIADMHAGNLLFMHDIISYLESKNVIDGAELDNYINDSYKSMIEKENYSQNMLMSYRHFLMLKGVIPIPSTGNDNEKK